MNETETVWLGEASGGQYSDSWHCVEGIYASREAGQRAARRLIEEKIALARTEQDKDAAIASGVTPFPEEWTRWQTEENWRTRAREYMEWREKAIGCWLQILAQPWFTTEAEPDGATWVENREEDWKFTLTPYEVQG